MKKLITKLFSKKEVKIKTPETAYGVEHSLKEWETRLVPSDKVDVDLIQDVVDNLLEDVNNEYLKELQELNKKHSVKIVKHKKEARMHKNENLHKLSISRSILPC